MEHDYPQERMTAAEDLVGVSERIDSSEETTVEPSSPLKDEIGHLFWDIGFAGGAFDILKDPPAFAL